MAGPPQLTRRRLLGGALTLVCAPPLLALAGCDRAREADAAAPGTEPSDTADVAADADANPTDTAGPVQVGPWIVPPGTTLEPARFALLAALFDALVPGDAASPGATETHAAWYLDQLLGAFRTQPPRVFAGGPYSGRHGGLDGFSAFLPLTRVEAIAWRTRIEGSQGLPEREFNGPVLGLRQKYEAGLDALDAAAKSQHQQGFAFLDRAARTALVADMDEALRATAYGHAVEGTYGDPVYGGNAEGRGWQAIGYEGDRQPIGFTARQLSHPEEG